ncbi:glucan biosynthesis protein G [Alsobacter sp. SYSU M60028]|uniref:Glucan biosynthesis protein G n=1 Tax=Alsobacter ponti TaxID=2962936 RepID=A0ABT1LIG7_9HYPH|nr:glucan biosynthesis protein G [Alsobacter ponti]
MTPTTRRSALAFIGAAAAAGLAPPALAQTQPRPAFGYDDVVARAAERAATAYQPPSTTLPAGLANLTYDGYRDIRFRKSEALLGGPFTMEMFHPGFLYTRLVRLNIVRDGVAEPVPYEASLFDYGHNTFNPPLPRDLGYAGFRLHAPLNRPDVQDELIVFLGASYFRFLGRGQRYGLSARGIAVGSGEPNEEFPEFREFWVQEPAAGDQSAMIWALLDGPSLAGAYQFIVTPGEFTTVEVTATLYARREVPRLGIAPLTSMFYVSENDRRFKDDFRPEVHDSDGLLVHTGGGEWLWRPLRNPATPRISSFADVNPRGFGLMQRDRAFEHYEDLEARYDLRPSYFVETIGDWGEGRVELVELPAPDETYDNIGAFWVRNEPVRPGQPLKVAYRISARNDGSELHGGGQVFHTFQTAPRAHGVRDAPVRPDARRFIVDFTGGELPYYLPAAKEVQLAPSVTGGRIIGTFLVPHEQAKGFRAGIDVAVEPGKTADIRAFLRAGDRALTETWTFPWAP